MTINKHENKRANFSPLFIITTMLGSEKHYFQGITQRSIVDPKTGAASSLKVNVWIPTIQDATIYIGRRSVDQWLKIIGADGCEREKVGFMRKNDNSINPFSKYVENFPQNIWFEGQALENVLKIEGDAKADIVKAYDLAVGDIFKPYSDKLHWYRVDQIFNNRIYYTQVTGIQDRREAAKGDIPQGGQRVLLLIQK